MVATYIKTILGVAAFLIVLGSAVAGDKTTRPLAGISESAPSISVYKDHSFARQLGLTWTKFTANDLAEMASVAWMYPLGTFPADTAADLSAALSEANVGVFVRLRDGTYAVMSAKEAEKIGVINYSNSGALSLMLSSSENSQGEIGIVASVNYYLGVKPSGTISHWNDPLISMDEFKKRRLIFE